jgi:hypothetical protein
MGFFKAKASGFEKAKQRFDVPPASIIIQSTFWGLVGHEEEVFILKSKPDQV